jgi:vancomycin resistance protein VanW
VTALQPNLSLKPIRRSRLRLWAGRLAYQTARYLYWQTGGLRWAQQQPDRGYEHLHAAHRTPLMRQLRDLEQILQINKITNLRLAAGRIDGVVLQPGETFSFWKRIGRPTYQKGYLDGMVLHYGSFGPGVGGGLCQLSNLLYWMTLHTPLTVTERHRHSFDVFPDSNRTQPFGSGATCVYNYRDLMIRNDTHQPFQLGVRVGESQLEGCWTSPVRPVYSYEIYEKNHRMQAEFWGGYSRHNEIWRRVRRRDTGEEVADELVVENHALMMYRPFLQSGRLQ